MKISLNWIKDYIKPTLSVEQLAHRLTMAGLEVEAVHDVEGDKVFEVEVTPNRADCLSMVGISRELSAILNKNRQEPKVRTVKYPRLKCDVSIADKKGCQRYIGTCVEGVDVKPAPGWIKKRLTSVGIRSVNNIVDITNFVLMETGQPLHAFDLDKLAGGKIIVRKAKKGEKIITLDGEQHKLDESTLVIADAKGPVAIAGVMGAKTSEVTSSTKNILLESAYFDPVLIRRTSRKLALGSDSSYRFERGVDMGGVKQGSDRAISLIHEIAGGKSVKRSDVQIKIQSKKRAGIVTSVERINGYLGAGIGKKRIQSIFKRLGFQVSSRGKSTLAITAPSHRPDIREEVDLIEEVARIEGYDNLPTSLPAVKLTKIPSEQKRALRRRLKNNLVAKGFNEIITYSMTNQESLNKARQGYLDSTRITNPLSSDQERLRPTMLPGMLGALSFNLNRGQKDLKFFEAGKIYIKNDEIETLSLAVVGRAHQDWRLKEKCLSNIYDIKGAILDTVGDMVGNATVSLEPRQETSLEELVSAGVTLGGKNIGYAGKVDEDVLSNFDIKDEAVYFAQIDLESVYKNAKEKREYAAISVYPPVVRDISLSFDKHIGYKKLLETIKATGPKFLVDIQFKEDYTNVVKEKIPKAHRGVLISLVYQSREQTLQENEVGAEHQKILDALVENLKAHIR